MGLRSGRNGLLVLLVFVYLAVLVLILGGRWAGAAAWVAGVVVRLALGDGNVETDVGGFTVFCVLALRREIFELLVGGWEGWWYVGVLPLIGFALRDWEAKREIQATQAAPDELPNCAEKREVECPRPWIFPCRTTHARMFPKRHAFGYSYLLCGFPITPASVTGEGTELLDGKDRTKGSWWLRIKAEDYLSRGCGSLGFFGKLKAFMKEQGVGDDEWTYAYLVTAPRFFGYSFNPVSFWYVYNRNHSLKKMILEVNNTFGERRIYLLDGYNPSPARNGVVEAQAANGSKDKFTDVWVKDFHVSPFNSRKGSYSLTALNPFPSPGQCDPTIDNTITLRSSKGHGKIVARVHSMSNALDPAQFGAWATLRFVAGWWWVGLVTFPRIIREAFKLYFFRSLHVWFRPEVISSSIGRLPTGSEIALQKIFQAYLEHLVDISNERFQIEYRTAIPDAPQQTIEPKDTHGEDRCVKHLSIHVITPAFYSRFIHYAHTAEALDRECLFTDEKNRTLWISQPEVLVKLLPKRSHEATQSRVVNRGFLSELRWKLMRRLRCRPSEQAYPVASKSATFDKDDIRSMPYSDVDCFVRELRDQAHAAGYRQLLTKIFLAQRFALGNLEMVDGVDLAIRFSLFWVALRAMIEWGYGGVEGWWHAWWRPPLMMLSVSGCHIYGVLKGYT